MRLQDDFGERMRTEPDSETLRETYVGLLRSAVLSTPEELQTDLARMAREFVLAGWGAADAFRLHTGAVSELLQGLGGRSARHVLQRTDLLAMEMLVLVAEGTSRPPFTRDVRDEGLDLEMVHGRQP